MKTFLLIAALILFSVVSQAQYMIALTPDTTGTILGTTGGVTHKYTSPRITSLFQYSVDVYVTASGTHATDSTHVSVWGSMDGTNYFQITTLGTPWLLGYGLYNSTAPAAITYSGYRLSSSGATAGWAWTPQLWMTWRYIQVRITQYKALSILTVNRCYLHTFAK